MGRPRPWMVITSTAATVTSTPQPIPRSRSRSPLTPGLAACSWSSRQAAQQPAVKGSQDQRKRCKRQEVQDRAIHHHRGTPNPTAPIGSEIGQVIAEVYGLRRARRPGREASQRIENGRLILWVVRCLFLGGAHKRRVGDSDVTSTGDGGQIVSGGEPSCGLQCLQATQTEGGRSDPAAGATDPNTVVLFRARRLADVIGPVRPVLDISEADLCDAGQGCRSRAQEPAKEAGVDRGIRDAGARADPSHQIRGAVTGSHVVDRRDGRWVS